MGNDSAEKKRKMVEALAQEGLRPDDFKLSQAVQQEIRRRDNIEKKARSMKIRVH